MYAFFIRIYKKLLEHKSTCRKRQVLFKTKEQL